MVKPGFENQRVPRPNLWEVPTFDEIEDFLETPPNRVASISDRFLRVLEGQYDEPGIGGIADHVSLAQFLRQEVKFLNTQDWEVQRMLGAGGFGRVGLWVRKDTTGQARDEVVLKEVKFVTDDRRSWYVDENGISNPLLLNEAVVQKEMNRKNCENFVHLRGYASSLDIRSDARQTIADPPAPDETRTAYWRRAILGGSYRLYLEYAPYGSLTTLKRRYRAWSQWIPEPFLWHVFDSLATTALYMSTQRPRSSRIAGDERDWPADTEVIHLDIKPDNVFMGYERLKNEDFPFIGGSKTLPYPVIKLGDFGLAHFTNPSDTANPISMWARFTRFFAPPELFHYGVGFSRPPNGKPRDVVDHYGTARNIVQEEQDDEFPGFKFLAAANVWNIGKVMYDLATLSHSEEFQLQWGLRETQYNANQQHLIPRDQFQTLPFDATLRQPRRSVQNPYSDELMNLIESCLEPQIQARISPSGLVRRTSQQVQLAEQSLTNGPADDQLDQGSVKRRKVYYRGHEINDMPRGNIAFIAEVQDYYDVMDDPYDRYPDETPLKPPADKWRNINRSPTPDNNLGWRIQGGRIFFDDSVGRGNSAASSPILGLPYTPSASPEDLEDYHSGSGGDGDDGGSGGGDNGGNNGQPRVASIAQQPSPQQAPNSMSAADMALAALDVMLGNVPAQQYPVPPPRPFQFRSPTPPQPQTQTSHESTTDISQILLQQMQQNPQPIASSVSTAPLSLPSPSPPQSSVPSPLPPQSQQQSTAPPAINISSSSLSSPLSSSHQQPGTPSPLTPPLRRSSRIQAIQQRGAAASRVRRRGGQRTRARDAAAATTTATTAARGRGRGRGGANTGAGVQQRGQRARGRSGRTGGARTARGHRRARS